MDQTVIIGAGPGGASAAIYLARFCHHVILIDAGEKVPGRTSMATSLRNFLGHTQKVSGQDFLKNIKKQIAGYAIDFKQEKVVKVSQTDTGFVVETDAPTTYEAKFVIVAVGLSDNMPEIEGLDPYYDTSIFHCLTCDWYDHKDQPAAIIANDDKGITTALALDAMHRPPSLVVVPSVSPNFSPQMVERAKTKNITVYESPLKQLNGSDGQLTSVTLEDGSEVATEVLFTRLGHKRFDQFLDEGGLNPTREGDEDFIKIDYATFESSIKNLFAVGPCNSGLDQAIIAAGEGAMAAAAIHDRILTQLGI